MSKIKYVIVDDEQPSKDLLRGMLQVHFPQTEYLGEACDVKSGLKVIREKQPDLLFLDIQMPGGSGFDLLDQLPVQIQGVIFITGYDQYAIRAIRYSALDYLLKPLSMEELAVALGRFSSQNSITPESFSLLREQWKETERQKILLPGKRSHILLEVNKIAAIQGEEGYSVFYLQSGQKHLATYTMGFYEEILPEYFFRIHKSCIINLTLVARYDMGRGGKVHLSNGMEYEVAARRKSEFVQRLRQFT